MGTNERGPAWWLVVPGAVVVATLGGILDYQFNHSFGLLFDAVYLVACVAAVSFVRPDQLFVPMATPPAIMPVALSLSVLVDGSSSQGKGLSAAVLGFGVPLLTSFPAMALTTALVLVIGGLRILFRRRGVRLVRAGYQR